MGALGKSGGTGQPGGIPLYRRPVEGTKQLSLALPVFPPLFPRHGENRLETPVLRRDRDSPRIRSRRCRRSRSARPGCSSRVSRSRRRALAMTSFRLTVAPDTPASTMIPSLLPCTMFWETRASSDDDLTWIPETAFPKTSLLVTSASWAPENTAIPSCLRSPRSGRPDSHRLHLRR